MFPQGDTKPPRPSGCTELGRTQTRLSRAAAPFRARCVNPSAQAIQWLQEQQQLAGVSHQLRVHLSSSLPDPPPTHRPRSHVTCTPVPLCGQAERAACGREMLLQESALRSEDKACAQPQFHPTCSGAKAGNKPEHGPAPR